MQFFEKTMKLCRPRDRCPVFPLFGKASNKFAHSQETRFSIVKSRLLSTRSLRLQQDNTVRMSDCEFKNKFARFEFVPQNLVAIEQLFLFVRGVWSDRILLSWQLSRKYCISFGDMESANGVAVLEDEVFHNETKALWVFAYGSLCWKPGFQFNKAVTGYVQGFHRRFWQGNTTHRGTEDKVKRLSNRRN